MRPELRQHGLSMMELMIAITIGLFLLVGMVSVFSTGNRTYMELNSAAEQIENGRFAVQVLGDDIAMAGFYGRYPSALTVPGTLPDPCEKSSMAALKTGAALAVQGYDAPSSSPITTCLAAANHVAGTDILVVRRAGSRVAAGDSASIPNGALSANGIYVQASSDTNSSGNPLFAIAAGTQASDQAAFVLKNKDGTNYAPIRQYQVHIYFVAPCSVPAGGGTVCTGASDDNGSPIPTLKRIELSENNTMTVVPLVEGIENFQVDYGVDGDGDGVPDGNYVTAPATPTDWSNVVAVRINVLARNLQASGDYSDTKVYDMGAGGSMSVSGGELSGANYKRHVYNAVIRLVNPAGRRES